MEEILKHQTQSESGGNGGGESEGNDGSPNKSKWRNSSKGHGPLHSECPHCHQKHKWP